MNYLAPTVGIYRLYVNHTNAAKDQKPYYGQSIDIKKRFEQHERVLKDGKHHNNFLQQAYNQNPAGLGCVVVKKCVASQLNQWEKHYIDNYRNCNERTP